MDDFWTLSWLYAVAVVQNKASGTLAARDAGLEAMTLYLAQRLVNIKARHRTWGAALVKHKPPLYRAAHS